jgi:5-methylcytosine-specific restriction endonuclease McrA
MDSELIAWGVGAGRLADVQLMAELRQLARADRRCEARILVVLAEVDERELFLAEGYSSLFRYAVCVLRMSEAQAYLRIGAARLARRYPAVLEMLAEGALNLSTVKLLAPQLTAENHATLLERARNKTKREVEALVAEIAPKPDVPTRIRKMPGRPGLSGSVQAELVMSAAPDVQDATVATSIAPAAAVTAPPMITTPVPTAELGPRAEAVTAPAVAVAPRAAAGFALESPRASCSVLSSGRYRLELTVDQALFDQMMTLKHLLKHRVPSGDLGVILGLAITGFSERLCKQRFAELSKPASRARAQALRNKAVEVPSARASQNEVPAESSARASHDEAPTAAARSSQRGSAVEHRVDKVERRSRYVPREVVRAVFARDGAQCTFVGADGERCAERGMLELHHVKAFAHGGAATSDNLTVVCRSHNSYFAVQDFGASHMRMVRVRTR